MSLVVDLLDAHLATVSALRTDSASIAKIGEILIERLSAGGRIYLCGNGGSAADAQHIAAELCCRYEANRRGLPAVALTTDTSVLTAVGNDFGFERIFARQVEALVSEGDLLICISTSGNSPNVVAAAISARRLGAMTIGLLGMDGGQLKGLVDHMIVVPSSNTARIQEGHILIGHILCAMVENGMLAGQR